MADYKRLGFKTAGSRSWPQFSVQLMMQREAFHRRYGYVLASQEVMDELAALLRPCGEVLDAGCGSGYLSARLRTLGVQAFAVDTQDCRLRYNTRKDGYPMRRVEQLDAVARAEELLPGNFGAVLLCWPPLGHSFAVDVARAMKPGQLLVYEGEGLGGCTGSDAFFEELAVKERWRLLTGPTQRLNRAHVTWDVLHDRWAVYRRR